MRFLLESSVNSNYVPLLTTTHQNFSSFFSIFQIGSSFIKKLYEKIKNINN